MSSGYVSPAIDLESSKIDDIFLEFSYKIPSIDWYPGADYMKVFLNYDNGDVIELGTFDDEANNWQDVNINLSQYLNDEPFRIQFYFHSD